MALCRSLFANCIAMDMVASSCAFPGGKLAMNSAAATGSACTQLARTERKALRWASLGGSSWVHFKAARASACAHCRATLMMD